MNSEQFADNFIMTHSSKLPADKIFLLKDKLKTLPESRQSSIQLTSLKNPIITLLLSLFLGYFGIDRFYIGDIGLGIIKILLWLIGGLLSFIGIGLLLLGIAAIWGLLDIYLCYKKTKEVNFNKLMLVA